MTLAKRAAPPVLDEFLESVFRSHAAVAELDDLAFKECRELVESHALEPDQIIRVAELTAKTRRSLEGQILNALTRQLRGPTKVTNNLTQINLTVEEMQQLPEPLRATLAARQLTLLRGATPESEVQSA